MGHLNVEELYAQALAEAESGQHQPGLWAKAFADAEGDLNRTKAFYIKLRVQAERDQEAEQLRTKEATVEAQRREEAARVERILEELAQKGYKARKTKTGWAVREPLGGKARLASDEEMLEYALARVSGKSANVPSPIGVVPSGRVLASSAHAAESGEAIGNQPPTNDVRRPGGDYQFWHKQRSNSQSMTASALLFSLEGRIPRSTYWLKYVVPYFVIYIVMMLVDIIVGTFDARQAIGVFSGVFVILTLYPSIAVGVKRCHDRNRSGWFLLVSIIPFVNLWVLIELGFMRGTIGLNRYGSDPLAD